MNSDYMTLGLILGIIFIFFPVWLTFVASTVTQEDIIKPPFPLLPGPHFFENYSYALFEGTPEGYGKNIHVLYVYFTYNSRRNITSNPEFEAFSIGKSALSTKTSKISGLLPEKA